jgi:hypothetical protein
MDKKSTQEGRKNLRVERPEIRECSLENGSSPASATEKLGWELAFDLFASPLTPSGARWPILAIGQDLA